MVETNTPITGIDPSKLSAAGQDIRDAKILELAKKVQKQNSVIESQKTKIKNLEEEIKLRKKIHEEKIDNPIPKIKSTTNSDKSNNQSEIKQYQKDISNLRMKLSTLEGEIKKYKIILQRELGDNVKISDIIDNESEWKGRQELITSLQSKIKKLESQISNKPINERAQKAINSIEKDKKIKMEDLSGKYKELESNYNTMKTNSII